MKFINIHREINNILQTENSKLLGEISKFLLLKKLREFL